MSSALPLAAKEGETLELKSVAALAEPETIARGAVALLNTRGGEVWVGIREGENENQVEEIPAAEVERQRKRLQDYLLDVIEPVPAAGEVSVTTVPVGGPADRGGGVLRVTVKARHAEGPYAVRRRGARLFVRRVADRTVVMSREEIVRAMHPGAIPRASPGSDQATEILQREMKALTQQLPGRFWIGLEPAAGGDLRLRDVRATDLLADPTRSGTPRGSFNFTAAGYRKAPRVEQGVLMVGDAGLSLRICRSGGVRFEAILAEHFWAGQVPYVDAPRLLSPEALLGYTLSVVRLMGKLLRETSLWRRMPEGDVWAALAMTGLAGWGLLPGDLIEWPSYRYQISRYQEKDLLLPEPLRFTHDDLLEHPDDCGLRLVERVYDAFEIDQLPSPTGAGLGHAGLPELRADGYSSWVILDLGGSVRKAARLRADPQRPERYEWETQEGDLIPADRRWVQGWRYAR
jgi:hypothetical protein